jgi:hypothetical protein
LRRRCVTEVTAHHVETLVAEKLLHQSERFAPHDEIAGEHMTDVVEARVVEVRSPSGYVPGGRNVDERLTILPRDHQCGGKCFVGVGVPRLQFLLEVVVHGIAFERLFFEWDDRRLQTDRVNREALLLRDLSRAGASAIAASGFRCSAVLPSEPPIDGMRGRRPTASPHSRIRISALELGGMES